MSKLVEIDFELPSDLVEKIKDYAKKNGLTVDEVINLALESAIKEDSKNG